LGCMALTAIVWLVYRKEFSSPFDLNIDLRSADDRRQPRESGWSGLILMPVVAAFFLSSTLGVDVSLIALVTGAAVLLLNRARPSEIIAIGVTQLNKISQAENHTVPVQNYPQLRKSYARVDWVLLLFFVGLFIVIGGAREAGVMDVMLQIVSVTPDLQGILSLHLASALVSQLVSNVPLTMLVVPIIEGIPGNLLWMSLASAATLAGNATLIGAVANIIVVERASREGVIVSFGEFLNVGILVTVVTLAISIGVLALEWRLGLLV
jgi:Na+/H+ antiporter NhaD/arsenite permease-like protein